MSFKNNDKQISSVKKWLRNKGTLLVRFDGGNDSRFIQIGSQDDKGWNQESEKCLQDEIAAALQIPWVSENQVTGEGTLSLTDGKIHLSYHLKDIGLDLSLEQEQLPVPDVENVRIEAPNSFPEFDFEIRMGVSSRSNRKTKLWYGPANLKTTPEKLSEDERLALIELLKPIVQPAFDAMENPTRIENDVFPVAISLEGYYWCASKEIYYSLELNRKRVRRKISKSSVVLFN